VQVEALVKYQREQLRKPPLVEAVFELRATCQTDATLVPGAIFGRLKNKYPVQESSTGLIIAPRNAPAFGSMHRFLREDRKHLIQCAPELFTVNVLGDYGAFPEFARLIEEGLAAFYEEAAPTKLKRLAIRYINFLPGDAIAAAGGDPLRIATTFPTDVLPAKDSLAFRGVFKFPEENGMLGVVAANPHRLADGRKGCLLDFDFFLENPTFLAMEDCLPWASRAHDVIYQAFRSSLAPAMYDQFEPISEGSKPG
jgi:uncharacterized protein (TIGR04255 family)